MNENIIEVLIKLIGGLGIAIIVDYIYIGFPILKFSFKQKKEELHGNPEENGMFRIFFSICLSAASVYLLHIF